MASTLLRMEKEAFTGLLKRMFEDEARALAQCGFHLSSPDLDSTANLLYNRLDGSALDVQAAGNAVTSYLFGYRHGLLQGKEKGRQERAAEIAEALARAQNDLPSEGERYF